MRLLLIPLLLALLQSVIAEEPKTAKADPEYRLLVLDWISANDHIVSICIYEQEWIPSEDLTRRPQKATLIHRAVVVGVHKGNIPIGTQLEFSHMIENPPKLFNKPFRSTVAGELRYFFFSDEFTTKEKGKRIVDDHNGFSRNHDLFSDIFRAELKSNPKLKTANEQDDARQPATAPDPKAKTKKKTKPESEGRSQ